jgi:hypothetical protein
VANNRGGAGKGPDRIVGAPVFGGQLLKNFHLDHRVYNC